MFKCFLSVLISCAIVLAQDLSQNNCNEEIRELWKEVKELKEILEKQGKRGLVKGLAGQNIAFDAVLSKSFNQTKNETTLIFDVVNTNIANAYNPVTGIFTVPEDGTYMFSWTIRGFYASSIYTRLLINGFTAASLHTDCSENRYDGFQATSSKTIIRTVYKGFDVFIENFPQRGQILSDASGQSGFIGTKLF